MDSDFEELPTDYEGGTDFRLTKTMKGQYADYSTSNWARRERSLDSNERSAIETHGLFNLNDYLPKQPNEQELQVIQEMFEASVDGQMYDPARWGNFYRPGGVQIDTSNSAPNNTSSVMPAAPKPAPAPVPTSIEEEDDIPFKSNEEVAAEASAPVSVPTDSESKPSAQDILAAIRNRK